MELKNSYEQAFAARDKFIKLYVDNGYCNNAVIIEKEDGNFIIKTTSDKSVELPDSIDGIKIICKDMS